MKNIIQSNAMTVTNSVTESISTTAATQDVINKENAAVIKDKAQYINEKITILKKYIEDKINSLTPTAPPTNGPIVESDAYDMLQIAPLDFMHNSMGHAVWYEKFVYTHDTLFYWQFTRRYSPVNDIGTHQMFEFPVDEWNEGLYPQKIYFTLIPNNIDFDCHIPTDLPGYVSIEIVDGKSNTNNIKYNFEPGDQMTGMAYLCALYPKKLASTSASSYLIEDSNLNPNENVAKIGTPIDDSNETGNLVVSSPTTESLSKSANFQQQINEEFSDFINKLTLDNLDTVKTKFDEFINAHHYSYQIPSNPNIEQAAAPLFPGSVITVLADQVLVNNGDTTVKLSQSMDNFTHLFIKFSGNFQRWPFYLPITSGTALQKNSFKIRYFMMNVVEQTPITVDFEIVDNKTINVTMADSTSSNWILKISGGYK